MGKYPSLADDECWLMQHRLHWGRSEDTTFPRLCQPRSKVPHPTMGDTCNHAPTTHMTHQGIQSSNNPFNCLKSHEGRNGARRRDRLLPVNCATAPPKQGRRWSKELRSKPASLPMCTSREARQDGLDRLLRTLLTAYDKLFNKIVPAFCL